MHLRKIDVLGTQTGTFICNRERPTGLVHREHSRTIIDGSIINSSSLGALTVTALAMTGGSVNLGSGTFNLAGNFTYNSGAQATIGGLGKAYTGVISATTGAGTTASPYGVTTIGCSFPALPKAAAFTSNGDGSYTAKPGGPDTQNSTCTATQGTFTLSAGNGVDKYTGQAQTLTVTVLADPAGNTDYAWRQTATNSALLSGTNYICSLSTDAVYVDTAK